MKSRQQLEIEACAGLSDKELEKRGHCGFAKMINRKRIYAGTARGLKAATEVIGAELVLARGQLEKAQEDLARAQATIAELEALDAPITDTSHALALIISAVKGKAE